MSSAEKLSKLEEGIFGVQNVKFGASAKEHGVLLQSVSCFRRVALAVILALMFALGCVLCYRWRATRAASELAATQLRRSAAECGAVIEGILLKQDEIDELARRLQQRRLFDVFLISEREAEEQFRKRVLKLTRAGNESAERKSELQSAFFNELQWFMDTMDAKVESIIGPLDAAFKEVPDQIHVLQLEIKAALPAFEANAVCGNAQLASIDAQWRTSLKARTEQMIKALRREEEHQKRDREQPHGQNAAMAYRKLDELASSWESSPTDSRKVELSSELLSLLLSWYSGANVDSIHLH